MKQTHHETLLEHDVELPSEQSTGYVFAGACAIAAVVFRSNDVAFWALLAGVCGFTGVAYVRPSALASLNVAWFRFAQLLSCVVTPVVMFVLFAGIVAPAGLLMQLVRDPLQRRRDETLSSYWIARDREGGHGTMRDQF